MTESFYFSFSIFHLAINYQLSIINEMNSNAKHFLSLKVAQHLSELMIARQLRSAQRAVFVDTVKRALQQLTQQSQLATVELLASPTSRQLRQKGAE